MGTFVQTLLVSIDLLVGPSHPCMIVLDLLPLVNTISVLIVIVELLTEN
jgi:hypothetical protein